MVYSHFFWFLNYRLKYHFRFKNFYSYRLSSRPSHIPYSYLIYLLSRFLISLSNEIWESHNSSVAFLQKEILDNLCFQRQDFIKHRYLDFAFMFFFSLHFSWTMFKNLHVSFLLLLHKRHMQPFLCNTDKIFVLLCHCFANI
jgi:hypothetical protein